MSILRNAIIVGLACLFFLPMPSVAATLQVSWNANTETDLAGYLVYYGTQSGNYSACYDAGKATGYQITGAQAGTTVYIAVSAYDTSGNESALSSEQYVTVPAQIQASDIKLVSPVNGSLVYWSPTLKWSGTGFTRYSVRVSKDNGSTWSTLYSGSGTSCTMVSLWYSIAHGTKITWYVQGTTASGQVINSSAGYFTKR